MTSEEIKQLAVEATDKIGRYEYHGLGVTDHSHRIIAIVESALEQVNKDAYTEGYNKAVGQWLRGSATEATRQEEGYCPECGSDKWWTINEQRWPNLIECGCCGHPRHRIASHLNQSASTTAENTPKEKV